MKERLLEVMKYGLILIIAGAVVGLLTHFSEFGVLGVWITAIATAAIAVHAFMSYQLASTIRSRDEDFHQQISDLMKAIATSNLANRAPGFGKDEMDFFVENMKYLYEKLGGKTKLFE